MVATKAFVATHCSYIASKNENISVLEDCQDSAFESRCM
jgi:hypothetical protein